VLQIGHYALVPPRDRRALKAAILIAALLASAELVGAGSLTAGLVVFNVAVVVAVVWAMMAIVSAVRDWRTARQPRITRLSAGVFAIWSLLVGGALVATLDSLRTEPFDGLNNLFQIPFALPWFLIPIGGIWSYETDAWIAAGMGWFNGLLILMFLSAWLSRGRERPGAA
jgi:hypothetical protein